MVRMWDSCWSSCSKCWYSFTHLCSVNKHQHTAPMLCGWEDNHGSGTASKTQGSVRLMSTIWMLLWALSSMVHFTFCFLTIHLQCQTHEQQHSASRSCTAAVTDISGQTCGTVPLSLPTAAGLQTTRQISQGSTRKPRMHGFINCRKFKRPVTLTLTLDQIKSHHNIHSTCRTTSTPNHVTVASRSTEIWPFEFRDISTLCEVWTLVIAFLQKSSKIGLRKGVDQVSCYHQQQSVLSCTWKWRRR